MTLGTGIFLSSVLLGLIFLFHTTKDRWNWKKGAKRFAIAFLIAALLGGGWIAYEELDLDIGPYLETAEPTKQYELGGIRLGSDVDDLIFAKGKPNKRKKNKGSETLTFVSEYSSDWRIEVVDNKVATITAVDGVSYWNGNLNGITIGTTLKKLLERLGELETLLASADRTTRVYLYPKYNTFYELRRSKVTTMGIMTKESGWMKFKK